MSVFPILLAGKSKNHCLRNKIYDFLATEFCKVKVSPYIVSVFTHYFKPLLSNAILNGFKTPVE